MPSGPFFPRFSPIFSVIFPRFVPIFPPFLGQDGAYEVRVPKSARKDFSTAQTIRLDVKLAGTETRKVIPTPLKPFRPQDLARFSSVFSRFLRVFTVSTRRFQ